LVYRLATLQEFAGSKRVRVACRKHASDAPNQGSDCKPHAT
jgi:hypothetical protein